MLSRRNFVAGVGVCSVAGLTHRAFGGNAFASPLTAAFGAGFQAKSPDPALVERARNLLKQAPFIETHNDLPSMLLEVHGDLVKYDLSKVQPKLCADIPRLCARAEWARSTGRCLSSRPRKRRTLPCTRPCASLTSPYGWIRSRPTFEQARTADDMERGQQKAGKIACLIGSRGWAHDRELSLLPCSVFL